MHLKWQKGFPHLHAT